MFGRRTTLSNPLHPTRMQGKHQLFVWSEDELVCFSKGEVPGTVLNTPKGCDGVYNIAIYKLTILNTYLPHKRRRISELVRKEVRENLEPKHFLEAVYIVILSSCQNTKVDLVALLASFWMVGSFFLWSWQLCTSFKASRNVKPRPVAGFRTWGFLDIFSVVLMDWSHDNWLDPIGAKELFRCLSLYSFVSVFFSCLLRKTLPKWLKIPKWTLVLSVFLAFQGSWGFLGLVC